MPKMTVNGVTLNYRESGDRNHPTLVFAHTILWGAEVFEPLIAALVPHFYIIDTDLHGHGQSGYRTPLTIEEMADDYAQLITQLAIAPVTWIGYSLGSMIGLRLALQQPDLLDKLVLIATNAQRDHSPLVAQTQQLWDLFRAGQRETIVDPAMQLFFARSTFQNQPHLVEQHRRKAIGFQAVEGMYQAAMAVSARDDVMAQLGSIRTPTLIIAGQEDVTSPPAEAEAMAARIPNAHLTIVEETSHLLLVEKPLAVTPLIRNFLLNGRNLEPSPPLPGQIIGDNFGVERKG